MDYEPLTIDGDVLARRELQRLELAYVKSGGTMPRGAFKRMVEIRQFVEPDFPAAKVIADRDAAIAAPEVEVVADAKDPEPQTFFQRVFGA